MSLNEDLSIVPFLTTPQKPELEWINVAIALAFILVDVGVSTVFRLGLGVSLLIAAARCIGQLALVATLLEQVFRHENPWTVTLIAFVLNLLGTIETVLNKSPRRFHNMFFIVLVGMLGSTIPIAVIGSKYAMANTPFWLPIQFIPIVGMLCGATISGIVVSVNYILKEFTENRDKIEIYLAFGATRLEACRPIAVQALRLALAHPINNMSVLGIIAIPGMMTGAILGGSSVQQAAKLQMIIMFMITASTTLASMFITIIALSTIIDNQNRIRTDRITDQRGPWLRGVRNGDSLQVVKTLSRVKYALRWCMFGRTHSRPPSTSSDDERRPLLP